MTGNEKFCKIYFKKLFHLLRLYVASCVHNDATYNLTAKKKFAAKKTMVFIRKNTNGVSYLNQI